MAPRAATVYHLFCVITAMIRNTCLSHRRIHDTQLGAASSQAPTWRLFVFFNALLLCFTTELRACRHHVRLCARGACFSTTLCRGCSAGNRVCRRAATEGRAYRFSGPQRCPAVAPPPLRSSFLPSPTPRGVAMSYMLPHLHSGYAVDQAILAEEDRVVVIRFGSDADPACMLFDETLYKAAEPIKNFGVVYLVDTVEVPDFNTMYELVDAVSVMFFFRNKHIMVDAGTGNNNKINWPMRDAGEFIDIVEVVYRGARKGRGLVVSPRDYSTKYRY